MDKSRLGLKTVLFCMLALAVPALVVAAATSAPIVVQSGAERWVAGTGFMKGLGVATLLGDPNRVGTYVIRVRLPARAVWPAHHHTSRLNATVLSGALLIGFGDHPDRSKMQRLTAGSFVSIPADTNYYDATDGAVTVIQEEGAGPLTAVIAK